MNETRWNHVLDAQDIVAFMDEVFPRANTLASIESLGAGRIVMALRMDEGSDRYLRPGGTLSGPTLMSLADTAMYFLVLSLVGREALAVTASLNMHFLRRPPAGPLRAEASMLKLGRRLAVGDVQLRSEGVAGPVAHATVSYALPASR
ncbi:MAG: PaaI family thioesterase [Myxococcota bacterium]